MENFLLPSKVEFHAGATPLSGTVVIMPCYHGYATTLGNAYRRVLLSSLPGSAVEYFKIKGVQHEFGAVEGVKEDVVEIMLNLKQLAVRVFTDEPVVLTLNGEPKAVLQDIDSYERTQDSLALLRILAISTKEIEAGRVRPAREALARIRRRVRG